MTNSHNGDSGLDRRRFFRMILAAGLSVTLMSGTAFGQSVDLSQWSPEYIRSIAGTKTFDTAADCAAVVPLDYTGRLTYWWTGPNEASPEIERTINDEFWAAWKATYPNI